MLRLRMNWLYILSASCALFASVALISASLFSLKSVTDTAPKQRIYPAAELVGMLGVIPRRLEAFGFWRIYERRLRRPSTRSFVHTRMPCILFLLPDFLWKTRAASEKELGPLTTFAKEVDLMRKFVQRTALFVPLLLGVAVLCAAGAPEDNRLLGREVDSNEASEVMGTACFYLKSASCSGCTGTKSTCGITTEYKEANSGGCSTGCSSTKLNGACSG